MKQRIILVLAILSYYLGVIRLFYWLNSKVKRIVTFHNVIPKQLLPSGKSIGLTDTVESFRFKIREIKKVSRISNDLKDSDSITITFDDGYKNQYEVASQILKEEGNLPAIFFVSGRNIDNADPTKALIVDLLLHWTLLAPNGNYSLYTNDNRPLSFELSDTNRMLIWQTYIWPLFTKDVKKLGRGVLAQLDSLYSIQEIFNQCSSEYLRLRLTGINKREMNFLHQSGNLIGWHTHEHFPLSKLTFSEQWKEISCNDSSMREVVFSYPYGEEKSVDLNSIKISEALGYPCAVSNISGSQNTGRFFMPRFALHDNKYLLHFELSGLKYFLQKRKLLCEIKE